MRERERDKKTMPSKKKNERKREIKKAITIHETSSTYTRKISSHHKSKPLS